MSDQGSSRTNSLNKGKCLLADGLDTEAKRSKSKKVKQGVEEVKVP